MVFHFWDCIVKNNGFSFPLSISLLVHQLWEKPGAMLWEHLGNLWKGPCGVELKPLANSQWGIDVC